jgi:hypothetical protein
MGKEPILVYVQDETGTFSCTPWTQASSSLRTISSQGESQTCLAQKQNGTVLFMYRVCFKWLQFVLKSSDVTGTC